MDKFFIEHAKTEYGYKANLLDFTEGKAIKIPEQIKDEIPTLNQQGFMKLDFDEYSEGFIERSKDVEYSVDVGCAYGAVVKEALKNGNKVIAFDMNRDHLKVLGASAGIEHLERLYLVEGVIPQDFNFKHKSLGSVMASRVMHFLNGEDFIKSLNKIYDALISTGKFYFTCVTPYHVAIREGFLDEYINRRSLGNKWPGEIENQWEINPGHAEYVRPFLHVFDVPELEKLLPNHGFKIEKISLFDYPNDTDSGGKGHVGFIARKV